MEKRLCMLMRRKPWLVLISYTAGAYLDCHDELVPLSKVQNCRSTFLKFLIVYHFYPLQLESNFVKVGIVCMSACINEILRVIEISHLWWLATKLLHHLPLFCTYLCECRMTNEFVNHSNFLRGFFWRFARLVAWSSDMKVIFCLFFQ